MAETNWRELCRELAQHAANAQLVLAGEGLWDGDEDDGLLERATTAIEADELAVIERGIAADCARAALARWGRYDPPAAGAPCPPMEDVGPLIAWLAEQACQAADASQSTDAGMLTWAAQVIGERVDEDAPAPPAAGAVGELVEWLRAWALGTMEEGQPATSRSLTRAADLLALAYATGPDSWEPIPLLPTQRHPEPVPVSERPWEREGWCDGQDRCWFCNSYSMGQWSYSLPPSPGQGWGRLGTMTHSLPHWAISRPRPLPQQETTNG